jgi:hypothetical protein
VEKSKYCAYLNNGEERISHYGDGMTPEEALDNYLHGEAEEECSEVFWNVDPEDFETATCVGKIEVAEEDRTMV